MWPLSWQICSCISLQNHATFMQDILYGIFCHNFAFDCLRCDRSATYPIFLLLGWILYLLSPRGAAGFVVLHARAAAWLWGTQSLVSKSVGAAGVGRDLRDLDHKNHRLFGLVAECTPNYIHSMLMSHSLQTLSVYRQQLIPCLQIQTHAKG